ncbi:MAG: hypothetical protein OXC57_12590 [Rhodobacteraceae bacterium]|nr:hypothetical protein [Paracoccaceae bacterium]
MASLDRNDRNSLLLGTSRSKVTLTPPSKGISPLLQGVMPDTAGFAIPLLIWIHLLLDFPKSTHRQTGENHPPFQADIFYRYPRGHQPNQANLVTLSLL